MASRGSGKVARACARESARCSVRQNNCQFLGRSFIVRILYLIPIARVRRTFRWCAESFSNELPVARLMSVNARQRIDRS